MLQWAARYKKEMYVGPPLRHGELTLNTSAYLILIIIDTFSARADRGSAIQPRWTVLSLTEGFSASGVGDSGHSWTWLRMASHRLPCGSDDQLSDSACPQW